jgi:hypothetical protein
MITARVPSLKQVEAAVRKAAEDYNSFSRETPVNEIALAIIARCDDLKAECDKLLKFADSAKPEPVQSSAHFLRAGRAIPFSHIRQNGLLRPWTA